MKQKLLLLVQLRMLAANMTHSAHACLLFLVLPAHACLLFLVLLVIALLVIALLVIALLVIALLVIALLALKAANVHKQIVNS